MNHPPVHAPSLLRRSALAVVFSTLASALVAPGCSSSSGDAESSAAKDCVQGEACACKQDCEQTCKASACAFTCAAGAKCVFHCPTGSCNASGAGNILLDCTGGSCALSCGTPRADCRCSDPAKCTTG